MLRSAPLWEKNDNIIFQDIEEIYSRNIDWEQFRESTILLTGPNGMLASYVMYMLIYLNEEKDMGIKIIAMARSKERFTNRFREYSNREYIVLITDSLLEPIRIDGKVDYIIHAASLASPQYYDVCPVDVLSPNVIGTYNLLNLAVKKKIKGFLLFSTGDIYGVVNGIDYVTEQDFGIIDPLEIHSCYSESKRMAETLCNSFMYQYGVPVKMLRIWHTYAPTMDIDKDPRVFASFMKNILNGQDIEIKSDGLGKRTFCYVVDAIAGLFVILTRGGCGEAYNICNTDQFVSIRDLAVMLVTLRKDVDIKVIWKQRPIDEHYTENTAIGHIAPSNEKLKKLGWEAKYDIKTGFGRVLSYFKVS
mgnify:FL=1